MRRSFPTVFLVSIILASACAVSQGENVAQFPADRLEHPTFRTIVEDAERNASEGGDTTAPLRTYGRHWLYGQGVGRTIVNVGTVVLFPPYALYLLGNAGLALAGYEPLYVTSALPEPARDYTLAVYDGITSVPGRITARIAGEEFQSASVPSTRMEESPAVSRPR